MTTEFDANGEPLAPDAAERDAHRRALVDNGDGVLRGEDIRFITRNVSDEERAAVVAVLVAAREADTNRVRAVARRDREPWARTQRVPEGISEYLAG